MSFGLGFYGAGDEISRKLDFESFSKLVRTDKTKDYSGGFK